MNTNDKLHALAHALWCRAMSDTDFSCQPFAIRIDPNGWRLLLNSRAAYDDNSFDRFVHPDKYMWRGLERIMVYKAVETALRDVKATEQFEKLACEMLCIEARQPGEHGRRRYYDATPEELAEAMGEE